MESMKWEVIHIKQLPRKVSDTGFHISLILSQTWISKTDNSETKMRGWQIVMPRL